MDKIDIFLSRPTWVEEKFKEGLNNFYKLLNSFNINPRTIGKSDYPSDAPLDEVISLMDKCFGIIVLGYPQIIIYNGLIKNEKVKNNVELPTEWNHIETSLAYAKGLPILLIHHKSVTGGVFDRGAVSKFIYEIDLTKTDWTLDDRIYGVVNSWIPKVLQFKKEFNNKKGSIRQYKRKIPFESVTIGTFKTRSIATEIRAKIFLEENTQPSVDMFLERIETTPPYCSKCLRNLSKKHASWMADGIHIGYYCKKCGIEYDGNKKDVANEVFSEVRRNYQSYYNEYKRKIDEITKGKLNKTFKEG